MPDAGDRARARRIIDRIRFYGVEVREMPGHENRGGTFVIVPVKVFDHHDASSRKSGEWGSLGLILDGTPRGIPGPLSNVQVARCLDGVPRIAWVADGTCSHAGVGSGYGLPTNAANPRTYGVEKANDGVGEPYTAAANYATNATFHAMAVESGVIPESFPLGHKEWTPRKIDPLYSMPDRRRQVGRFQPSSATPIPDLGDLDMHVLRDPNSSILLWTPISLYPISSQVLSGAAQKMLKTGITDVTWAELDALAADVHVRRSELALSTWSYVGADGGGDAYQRLNDILGGVTNDAKVDVDEDALAAKLAPLINGASKAEIAGALRTVLREGVAADDAA